MTGFINVYKEKGYTSHDVVAILRKLAGTKKVGHTGTLDPNAQGVLPICVGRATKLSDYVMAARKTYVAEVILGLTTDTQDITGSVLSKSASQVDTSVFAQAATRFVGDISQVPPMFSAIKVNGKKLYELARKGEVVERKPRAVTIYDIQLLSATEAVLYGCETTENDHPAQPRFFINVDCSKGTYIRSLCADIGDALGCGAAMGTLIRTQSGSFSLESAVKLEELRERAQKNELNEIIIPVETVLPYPRALVSSDGLRMAMNGNALPDKAIHHNATTFPEKVWLYSEDNYLIGLFTRATDTLNEIKWRAEVMF